MRSPNSTSLFAALAGSAAMALAFNTPANGHPLLDDNDTYVRYGLELSKAAASATGDDYARIGAGSLAVKIETALKDPADKVRTVSTPDKFTQSMLVLAAVIPARG